jgi:hypothetical protein
VSVVAALPVLGVLALVGRLAHPLDPETPQSLLQNGGIENLS